MKYNVHFMGYYGYDVEVEANSEDEAEDKATAIFEETNANEFFFESNGVDIWEINK